MSAVRQVPYRNLNRARNKCGEPASLKKCICFEAADMVSLGHTKDVRICRAIVQAKAKCFCAHPCRQTITAKVFCCANAGKVFFFGAT